MTPNEDALFLAGYAAAVAGESRADALTAERITAEAIALGVRRVYRKELDAAFLRGRLWGQRDFCRRLREEHFEEDADIDTPIPGLDGGPR